MSTTMKHMLRTSECALALALLAVALCAMPAPAAQFAYVTNSGSDTVSVVDRETNTVVATVSVGANPVVVAITPDGAFAYVASCDAGTVSVISTATNTVIGTVAVGACPAQVAITPNGAFAYVTNRDSNTVSVIATATNTVNGTVPVGVNPAGIAITPDGAFAYVTNQALGGNTVSVIDTATNTVVATVAVGINPCGVAFTPDGAFAYVANHGSNTVSVISTATKALVAGVPVGTNPVGVAITPDGASAYVPNSDSNTVSAIDTATRKIVAVIPIQGQPRGLGITPDGAFAYVTISGSKSVSVIAVATNTVVASMLVATNPSSVAFTPMKPATLFGSGGLKTSTSYEFFADREAQRAQSIQLTNAGPRPQSAVMGICYPHSNLTVSLNSQKIIVGPGQTQEVPLIISSDYAPLGTYDGLLLKVTGDDGITLYSNLKVRIGQQHLPDLAINSSDIRAAVNSDGSVTLSAHIHNLGVSTAVNVPMKFYDFDRVLGEATIDQVLSDGTRSISITVPLASGDHLIRAVIDPSDTIPEIDKTNNSASRIIEVGSPAPSTAPSILVTGSLPPNVYTSSLFTVTGRAVYDLSINGTANTANVLMGGLVQFTITGTGGAQWVYGEVHTDTDGYFSKVLEAPAAAGTYHITMTVKDNTVSEIHELVFSAIDSQSMAPGGNSSVANEGQIGGSISPMAHSKSDRPTVSPRKGHPYARKGVMALAVNGDGSAFAGASTDKRIRVWSATTGQQRLTLQGSLGLPTGLAFSPGGSTLSSVGKDSLLRVWDTVGGTALTKLPGHEARRPHGSRGRRRGRAAASA